MMGNCRNRYDVSCIVQALHRKTSKLHKISGFEVFKLMGETGDWEVKLNLLMANYRFS